MNKKEVSENKIIIGKKLKMTQVFSLDGKSYPVTRIKSSDDLSYDMAEKKVTLIGKSKGKGFTGVIKRWHFHGGPATHGQSDKHRSAGSIGAQSPGRVFKGKKMAGRKGNKRITLCDVKIVQVNLDTNELLVSGPVPGAINSKVTIMFR